MNVFMKRIEYKATECVSAMLLKMFIVNGKLMELNGKKFNKNSSEIPKLPKNLKKKMKKKKLN